MAGFVHQGFLQRFPYEEIDLKMHQISSDKSVFFLDYKEHTALSDATGKFIRTINVSELDGRMATSEDWNTLSARLSHVHTIVILDDRPMVDNDIVKAYADRTLRIYIRLFLLEGKECLWTPA